MKYLLCTTLVWLGPQAEAQVALPKSAQAPQVLRHAQSNHEGPFSDTATIAQLNVWISKRSTRIATEETYAGFAKNPGSAPQCVTIAVMLRRDMLTDAQWRTVIDKTLAALRADEQATILDALTSLCHIDQARWTAVKDTAKEPLLTSADLRLILEQLIRLTESTDPQTRSRATSWVGQNMFAAAARGERVEAILRSMKDTDADVRKQSLHAISALLTEFKYHEPAPLGAQSDAVIAALREAAKDADRLTSIMAITSMGSLGDASRGLVPELFDIFKNGAYPQQRAAMRALEAMGPRAEDAALNLLTMLDSPDVRTKDQAIRLLGSVGHAGAIAVPRLTELLDDANPEVAYQAAKTLMYLGPDALPALARLEGATAADPQVFEGYGAEACAVIKGGPLNEAFRRAWEQ